MLDDKRKILGCVLIIFLFCSTIVFYILDNSMFCNIMIKSEEKLMQMYSDKIFVEHADNIGNLLLFNGQSIPYDEESNCFYVCQNIGNKRYSGAITSASKDTDIWIVKDDYMHEFKDAVEQGHSFSVWIAEEGSYTICNMIFTGFPVVALNTEGEVESEYLSGNISVWNPYDEEIGTFSCKESHMQIKCSESMETYTAKLMDNEDVEHRKLSLLNMGKYDAWKFYSVSQKDMTYVRSMLSYLLWNRINTTEKFNRPCQYAEVVVNNEYKGLFLVAPRIDDDFLELGETGKVISVKLPENEKDDMVYSAEDAFAVETLNVDNLAEYFLFLEMTYAYENVSDDFYVIWDATCEQSFLMPGKIEYSFGIFPNRLQYMTYQAEKRLLTPQLLDMEELFSDKDMKQLMEQRWNTLRHGELSNDELIRMIDELQIYLNESGYVARCEIANDNANAIEELKSYLTLRTGVLDRYYEVEDIIQEDAVTAEAYNYTGYTDISLQMDNGVVSQNIKMYMKGDKCYFFLPTCAPSCRFTIQYKEELYEININGKPIVSGDQIAYSDLSKQYTLAISARDDFASYSLEFMQSENLPVVFIETANGTMEYVNQAKTNKEAGEMICILPDGSVDSTGTFSIHARGSASFETTEKKQYKMTLDEAVDILSMGKGHKWILQANALDATKIRNGLAYEFARNLGLQYAVDSTYADVYFNGEYGGNYLICEPIELGENRIAIDEETSYLFAEDRVSPGDDSFVDQYEQTFDIRYPQENADDEVEWLRTHINDIEDLITACDTREKYQKIQAYIDIDSFVNMYLINSIMNETDANDRSYFFYIDGNNGKLYAGPAWDYDRSWGNNKRRGSYRFNVYRNGIPEQLAMIPYFQQDIQKKLQNSQEALIQLQEDVETMSNKIRASIDMEMVCYEGKERGFVDLGDYDANIAFLKYYLENRVDWISNIIFHPDIYHQVFVKSDEPEVTYTYWVKDGETIPADDLAYIYEVHYCDSLLFEDGKAFWDGYPVLSDIVLYGHSTEAAADEMSGEEIAGASDITAETDRGIQGMGLLTFIIILAPGFIALFISTNWGEEKDMGMPGLLIRYFCYDFLILMFTYGSIYCIKGAITISLTGAPGNAFDYTIYNVNVVFLLMLLELIGACALGYGIRIYRKFIEKREENGKKYF